jgi:hypothetical protein
VTGIIWSQIYSIHSNSSMFVGIFTIIDYIESKANQIYLKQVEIIQDVVFIHYLKIKIAERLYLWLQILGGLMCFHPIHHMAWILCPKVQHHF